MTYAERAHDRLGTMLEDVERLVRVESPSSDHRAVARGADEVAALLRDRLGSGPRRVEVEGVPHLVWRRGPAVPVRVALLCHQDTVWPVGTLDRLPYGVRDGVLRGPGCFDMLTGLVMAVHALALLAEERGPAALDQVVLLVTGDEELGSRTSRDLLLAEAAGAEAALVLEAAGPGGSLKLSRKGVSQYRLLVDGRAAHAGLEPERGVNAGLELAHQLPAVVALADPARGTTVTPTTLSAGTTANTVPASAQVDLDVRATTAEEQQRVDAGLRGLRPRLPGAALRVEGGVNRPPMGRESSAALFERYRAAARREGVAEPDGCDVGGASDGNLTAGAGIPTLDGLGAVGGGAHADSEHVEVAHVAPRTAVLAALLTELLA